MSQTDSNITGFSMQPQDQIALFESIINSTSDAVFSKNLDGIITSWNHGAEMLYGYTAEEIMGKNVSILIPSARSAELFDILDKVGTTKKTHRFKTERLKKDGSTVHISLTVSPIKNEDGIIVGIAGIAHDISEQVKKEVELKRSLKDLSDYKYALDESAIVAITDQKGVIKYVNDYFCTISKYSREELIGQDHRIINSGYHPKDFIKNIWTTIASGSIWKGEIKNKAKDGSTYWVDTTIIPFLNDAGKPYQYVAIRSDITQKKETEELQKNLEENIQAKADELVSIFERITDGFISLDNDFRYTYANKKIGEMTNRDPETLIGKNVWGEFPDAVGSATYHAFNEAMTTQKYVHNTDYFEGLDLWQENYIYPSKNGLSVFVRDVTEQKKAEAQIIKSEKIYKTIASSIPGSYICLLDKNLRYILLEGDMLEKLGYSKEKLIGQKMVDVIPKKMVDDVLPSIDRVFNGETFTEERTRGEYDILYQFVPLRDEFNKVYAAMVVAIDVTELKSAERKIVELNVGLEQKVIERTEQLEIVNKELEAFTYSVSHDLRAPLRIIDGFADILLIDYKEELDSEGIRTLNVIKTNAQKMGQLIDDLLNLSRLGRKELVYNPVKMEELVQTVIVEQLLLHKKHADINCKTLINVHGDNNLMQHVWTNLISNALKYSGKKDEQHILIDSYMDGDNVVYCIKDNGVGFDMRYADKLFGVFQRLHKQSEFDGTGVGLALVQRIILKHHGKIWADSKPGEGATFYFSLPLNHNT